MIKVRQVSKSFGAKEVATQALNQVNLDLYDGEMASIMGPSGCGKSTLLNVLAGIEQVDAGEIWIDETPLHQLNDDKLSDFRLEKMGFIFQQYHLIPVLNALENVMLPLISKDMNDNLAKKKALAALEAVGLQGKERNLPAQLSGGQAQRVAIARAIVGNPKIIWADEPTGALDSHSSKQIMALLNELNVKENVTIVVVTHDPLVAQRTTRTVFMENGKIRHGGD